MDSVLSWIKIPQFPQRRVILRPVNRRPAENDVVEHLHFHELPGPDQIARDLDVSLGWRRVAAWMVVNTKTMAAARAAMADLNTSRGCTRIVSSVPCDTCSTRIKRRRVLCRRAKTVRRCRRSRGFASRVSSPKANAAVGFPPAGRAPACVATSLKNGRSWEQAGA